MESQLHRNEDNTFRTTSLLSLTIEPFHYSISIPPEPSINNTLVDFLSCPSYGLFLCPVQALKLGLPETPHNLLGMVKK